MEGTWVAPVTAHEMMTFLLDLLDLLTLLIWAFFDGLKNDSKPRQREDTRLADLSPACIFKKMPRTVHLHCGSDHNQLKSPK
jgi:hypothetical protein